MLVLLLTSLLAQAPAPRDEARRLFQQGEAQFGAGALPAAEQSFAQSYALLPLAATAWNLARCTEAANAHARALGWYRRYLRLEPTAADRTQVEASIRRLEKQLAARRVQALTLFLSPPEASASLDGGPGLSDGATIELPAGPHRLVVSSAGAAPAQLEVTLSLAASQEVSVTLTPLPVATDEHGFVPPPQAAPLPTDVPAVVVDDAFLQPAPSFTPTPQVSVVPPPLAPARKLRVTWVGVGLTVAGIIGGVAFGLAANGASAQLRDGKVRGQTEVNELVGTVDTTAPLATASWIVAGVGAAGTAVALGVEW